ncbi:MAG: carboxylesterase family protein, partial [Gammaproteobacteria bacterium]|nr:carboxylesterase family protein [Gammaproteobacteria bacterium]
MKQWKFLREILIGILFGFCTSITTAASIPVPTDIVKTSNGAIRGLIEDNGVAVFKGVRYGASPTEARRFLPPVRPEPWSEVLDATGFGAPAMQLYSRNSVASDLGLQLATIFTTRSDMKIDNEDCLFLNVWTPDTDDAKRPVMVWLHGGGYAYGSGAWPVYDGARLANKGDVVVVTVNHRLNVFGYLHLAEVAGDRYAHSGNAGMLDIVLALEWVRDNAAAFGGDAGNVTIMGESGGGSKVSHLLAMPGAAGLFHRAIIQSGPGLTGVPSVDAARAANSILQELGIDKDNLDLLQQLPAQTILDAVQAATARAGGGFAALRLAPVVDGDVLPRDPFTPTAPEVSRDVPILIGWNKDEMTIFNTSAPWFGSLTDNQLVARVKLVVGDKTPALLAVYRDMYPDYSPSYIFNAIVGDSRMFRGSVTLAERKAAQNGAPVYQYYLTWETPVANGVLKAPHTLDIPFMFNNVDIAAALTGDSDEARALEHQMSSSWITFARTGNPNNPAVPDWP